jgi:hypothetical protein
MNRRRPGLSHRHDAAQKSLPVIARPGTLLKPKSPRLRHRHAPDAPRPPADPCPPTARRRHTPRVVDIFPLRSAVSCGSYRKRLCQICGDPFGYRSVILFSCGHVCHTECFASARRGPSCPLCRACFDFSEIVPADAYVAAAARHVQRIVRGFLVRANIGRIAPPGSTLHRRWVLGRAQTASTMLVDPIENQADAVDAILASIDKELDSARTVMSAVDAHERVVDWASVRRKIERQGCGACSTSSAQTARSHPSSPLLQAGFG